MLEHYYKERRSVVDFRRGVLGPYFDPFTEFLQEKGYSDCYAKTILGTCCQFNVFLMDEGVIRANQLSVSLVEKFLDVYLATSTSSKKHDPRTAFKRELDIFMSFLTSIKVFIPPKPKEIRKPYSWILAPYLQHLEHVHELSRTTVDRAKTCISDFLEATRQKGFSKKVQKNQCSRRGSVFPSSYQG